MFPLVAVLTKTRPGGQSVAAAQPERVCDPTVRAQVAASFTSSGNPRQYPLPRSAMCVEVGGPACAVTPGGGRGARRGRCSDRGAASPSRGSR
jgi:hypothetical protein